MSKRFTDTAIWDKAWFRKLPPRLKEAWRFLCDKCDHAGLWDIDIEALCFYVGEEVLESELEEKFKIQRVSDKFFIPGFIEFQYNCLVEDLNPENKVHQSVISLLKKEGLLEPLPSPMQGAKDKDKDKDKEKDQEKEKEKETEKPKKFDFELLYKKYPLKVGKSKGIDLCKRNIKTQEDYDLLSQAIERYAAWLNENGPNNFRPPPKHFSTFMGCWRDFTLDDFGKNESFIATKIEPILRRPAGQEVPDAMGTAEYLRALEADYMPPADPNEIRKLIRSIGKRGS